MFTIGAIFWLIYIVAIVFTGISNYRNAETFSVGNLLFWVLIGLLGWGTFGSPIK